MRKSLLYYPLSLVYKAVVGFRHRLYDSGLKKSVKFDIPIICVGNITVGGTGKTPMTEFVISHFADKFNVAVLSRGYGRRTKGYLEVQPSSHYRDVGDEPLQIKLKFSSSLVVVCEDRVLAVNQIKERHPEVNLIIMDDGFQHRSIEPLVNIITLDATRPIHEDKMLPYGNLRDTLSSLDRAHYFVVTKCSDNMQPIDKRLWRKRIVHYAYQKLFFTRYVSYQPEPLFPADAKEPLKSGQSVIAVSGIGNPTPFLSSVKEYYDLVDHIDFNDHHAYSVRDVKHICAKLKEHEGAAVVITEKDAVKLRVPDKLPLELRSRLYYIPMHIDFIDEPAINFLNNLEKDVRQN